MADFGAYAGLVAFVGVALARCSPVHPCRATSAGCASGPEARPSATPRRGGASELAASRAEELRDDRAGAPSRAVRRPRSARCGASAATERPRPHPDGAFRDRLGRSRPLSGLIIAAVVVLGAGVAYARHPLPRHRRGQARKDDEDDASLQPKNIEVSVLNGTGGPGPRRALRGQARPQGLHARTRSRTPSSFAKSVVMYRRGRGHEARQVSQVRRHPQAELMTQEIAASAASAEVAVVVGEDQRTRADPAARARWPCRG